MSQLSSAVAIIESELKADLNSTLLFAFLMGIYTVVYVGTLYAYLARNASQRHLVVATITIIYFISILQSGVQWWTLDFQFIKNGETRDTVLMAYFSSPFWVVVINVFNPFAVIVLADGLLIWRCFHLWDRSRRVMALPMFLWVAEIGLALSTTIFEGIIPSHLASQKLVVAGNGLLSTTFFLSFATTVMATSMIAYRIYSVAKQNGSSVRRFKHILDIVVQSSVLYSLALLVEAISSLLQSTPDSVLNTRIFALANYAGVVSFVIPGLTSTIMVARVALLAPNATDPSIPSHLSGLQFQGRSTAIRTRSGMESIVIVEADSCPAPIAEKDIL